MFCNACLRRVLVAQGDFGSGVNTSRTRGCAKVENSFVLRASLY